MVKHSILIVDDDSATVQFLEILFTGRGYGVISATNGAQGIELARRHRPDLVMVDVMMPGMDGYQVCGWVRSNPVTAAVPVVMLSGKADPESVARGLEVGADEYLSKPISPGKLTARLRGVLART